MRTGIVAVWDADREYAAKLSEYLDSQRRQPSAVVMYSDPETLKQAVETKQVSMTLAGRPVASSPWLEGTPVMTLTERREKAAATVYKYQPAYEVLRALTCFQETAAVQELPYGEPARLRAIYSPLGGCLKTSFGLVMGYILAENKDCLFVSLEAHSGFRTLFERQYPADLSDLFAAVRQGGSIRGRLPEVMQAFGKLKYIPPVIWPEDVREAERGELKELLKTLAQGGGFDELIVDVGQDLARPEEVLSWSDDIYMLEKADAFSKAKLSEYGAYLKQRGYEGLLERTHRIALDSLSEEIPAAQLNQWQRWEQLVPKVRRALAQEEADA